MVCFCLSVITSTVSNLCFEVRHLHQLAINFIQRELHSCCVFWFVAFSVPLVPVVEVRGGGGLIS
jgi:hypothetical protein